MIIFKINDQSTVDGIYNLLQTAYFPYPMSWSKTSLATHLAKSSSCYFGVQQGKVLIGVIGFDIQFERADLLNLAVHPDWQHQGVAQRLLETSFDALQRLNVERLILEVRDSNKKACLFYEKMGFNVIAHRKMYYQQPNEDALIYLKNLGGGARGENFSD